MSESPAETHSSLQPLVLAVVHTRQSATHLENARFEINQPRCVVGCGGKANLAIEKAGLDQQHCEFVRHSMGTYVRMLSDTVVVNGQSLPEAWIYCGDVLSIGDIDLQVEALGEIQERIQAAVEKPSGGPIIVESVIDRQACDAFMPPFEEVAGSHVASIDMTNDSPASETATDTELQAATKTETGIENPLPDSDTPEDEVSQPIDSSQDRQEGDQANSMVAAFEEFPGQMPKHEDIESEIDSDWQLPNLPAGVAAPLDPEAEQQCPASEDIVAGVDWNASTPASDTESQWVQQALNDLEAFQARQEAEARQDEDNRELAGQPPSAGAEEILPPAEPGSCNEWIDNPHEEDHAKWLDELYDAAMPENELDDEQASVDLNAEDENLGWMEQRESNVSEIMQTGNDPAETPPVPRPSREESEQLFSKIESTFNPEQEADMDTTEKNTAESIKGDQENRNESVAELLARMQGEGKIGSIPTDKPMVTPESISQMIADETGESELPNPVSERNDEDASVNDYMSQLFDRLRSDSDPDSATLIPTPSQPAAPTSQSPATPTVPVEQGPVDDLTPANPLKADEYKPSGAAHEQTSTLDALRQVANQSVMNAIQRSVRKKKFSNSILYLIGTGVAFFLSSLLFLLSQKSFDACFIGGILFAVACAASGFMFVQINLAKEKMSPRRKVPVRDDAAD